MKILVGLSGGADSAAAAKLLIDEGHEVSAVTLRLVPASCSRGKDDKADIRQAKNIADKLGIPHFVYDFRNEFSRFVVDYFIQTYKNGKTPNPCFICNPKIKFGLLMDKALASGFDAVATGHYAGIEKDEKTNRMLLCKGSDPLKDQSYFLGMLNQHQLKHIIFPLYKMQKSEVKKIAAEAVLVKAEQSESQDICFVPDDDYAGLINSLAGSGSFSQGSFLDCEGKIIGKHKGLQYYTIGQRRGLALAFGYPVYVISKNAAANTVTVGKKEKLFSSSLIAENVNLIAVEKINEPMSVTVKTRYRQTEKKALLLPEKNGKIKVQFESPEPAVAEGQAAVFYSGSRVIGAGIIAETFP